MPKRYFVYIITNRKQGVLYTGYTDNLCKRIRQHQEKVYPGSFSARYNLDKLVYDEEHRSSFSAFTRERQMKAWKREWKIRLIESENPEWIDQSIQLLKD